MAFAFQERAMKPFGWISVIYMVDKSGKREGVFLKSRIQLNQIDAERCAREWQERFSAFLTDPTRYEFTAELLYSAA